MVTSTALVKHFRNDDMFASGPDLEVAIIYLEFLLHALLRTVSEYQA